MAYYRRNHAEGQEVSVVLGVEKRGMVGQLASWFGGLDLPIVATGGYASQTYCDEIVRRVQAWGRPAVLLYAGDHDPTGEDIERDLIKRTGCWKATRRVALTAGQVVYYRLPEPGAAAGRNHQRRAAYARGRRSTKAASVTSIAGA